MNNADTTVTTNNILLSGSKHNIRYEISNVNNSKGTFTLLIRRGDDSTNDKVVLEQFNNISLDPFDPNFIGSAVGTQRTEVKGTGANVYLETIGDFPNISRYVYVTDIKETPNYSDAEGNVRVGSYSSSIPSDSNGGFGGGAGAVTGVAKFGKDITTRDLELATRNSKV